MLSSLAIDSHALFRWSSQLAGTPRKFAPHRRRRRRTLVTRRIARNMPGRVPATKAAEAEARAPVLRRAEGDRTRRDASPIEEWRRRRHATRATAGPLARPRRAVDGGRRQVARRSAPSGDAQRARPKRRGGSNWRRRRRRQGDGAARRQGYLRRRAPSDAGGAGAKATGATIGGGGAHARRRRRLVPVLRRQAAPTAEEERAAALQRESDGRGRIVELERENRRLSMSAGA